MVGVPCCCVTGRAQPGEGYKLSGRTTSHMHPAAPTVNHAETAANVRCYARYVLDATPGVPQVLPDYRHHGISSARGAPMSSACPQDVGSAAQRWAYWHIPNVFHSPYGLVVRPYATNSSVVQLLAQRPIYLATTHLRRCV